MVKDSQTRVLPFEVGGGSEFALVFDMSVLGPVVGRINHTHALEAKQREIGSQEEFSIQVAPDGA